jgi:hemerythrin-like domain-containing protein
MRWPISDNYPMLRDKGLIPLSRQHQHALALCVRLNRASLATPAELAAWQSEIQQHFQQEIRHHFAAEEAHIFPAACRYPDLRPLVDELLAEHTQLRGYFGQAASRALDATSVRRFADALSSHIRKEERQLFEAMQNTLSRAELKAIGALVEEAFEGLPDTCIVPTESTLGTHNR